MSDHPSSGDLDRFVRGDLAAGRAQQVVAHLARRCDVCLARLEPALRQLLDSDGPARSEYDPAIDRAFSAVTLHGMRALHIRAETRRIKAELTALWPVGPPRSREGAQRTGRQLARRLAAWGPQYAVYEALLERSWEVRFDDLRCMMVLSRWACRLAPRLAADGYGARQVADFAARAWGEHANALRAAHRLSRAAATLDHAATLARGGTGDRRLQVRLMEIEASLLAFRRRFELAVALLEVCHRGYLEVGDRERAVATLVTRATYSGHAGQLDLAGRLLDEAIGMLATLGDQAEPALRHLALFNRIWLLADAGDYRRARTLLWKNRLPLAVAAECRPGAPLGRIGQAKLAWLEGHINAGLGELERAERALRRAAAILPVHELPALRCQLSLELAAVLLRQERWAEARKLAAQGARRLIALDLPREGAKALDVLRAALAQPVPALSSLESVIRFLRRSQMLPKTRFERVS